MKPGDRLGSYEIRSQLGKGGMGEVFKAYDSALERFVAVKTLPYVLSTDDALRARFKTEAQALARVRHPNLVSIYVVGEQDGLDYFAMEYIEGRSLASLIEARNRLEVRKAFFIVGEVLGALYKLHQAQLVHRDIKPGNIMIDRDSRVILMDLGLAKTEKRSAVTTDGTILGTPQYISPEQAQGEHVDMRSDIYSLGVVLYEMVCGVPPFTGKSAFSIIRQHVETPPPPVKDRVPDISPESEYVINTALQKDQSLRFQDAAEMAAAMLPVIKSKTLRSIVHDARRKGRELFVESIRSSKSNVRMQDGSQQKKKARAGLKSKIQWVIIGGIYLMALTITATLVVVMIRNSQTRTTAGGPAPAKNAFRARITMKNGKTIEGRVMSYSKAERVFSVKLEEGGSVKLRLDELDRMARME